VHVVHEDQHRAAGHQWAEERQAVLHVDDLARRRTVVPGTDHGDPVTRRDEALRHPLHILFGSAALWVATVTPADH
jgi:hypothetical protein